MKNMDLFGGETDIDPSLPAKKKIGYREATDERRCKTCDYLMKKQWSVKVYYKCAWLGNTNGTGTDIQLKRVCNYYKEIHES